MVPKDSKSSHSNEWCTRSAVVSNHSRIAQMVAPCSYINLSMNSSPPNKNHKTQNGKKNIPLTWIKHTWHKGCMATWSLHTMRLTMQPFCLTSALLLVASTAQKFWPRWFTNPKLKKSPTVRVFSCPPWKDINTKFGQKLISGCFRSLKLYVWEHSPHWGKMSFLARKIRHHPSTHPSSIASRAKRLRFVWTAASWFVAPDPPKMTWNISWDPSPHTSTLSHTFPISDWLHVCVAYVRCNAGALCLPAWNNDSTTHQTMITNIPIYIHCWKLEQMLTIGHIFFLAVFFSLHWRRRFCAHLFPIHVPMLQQH